MSAQPAPPADPVTAARPAWRRSWDLIAGPVLHPTRVSLRRFALAAVVANVIIMSTGEAVRLSASGLGCPDWPDCTARSLVAASTAGQTTLNTWIEFGNRLLNVPLVVIAGLTFIAACRYRSPRAAGGGQAIPGRRRRDLIWLAAALPGGVVGQAVVGGIVVLTKLNPAWVAAHFMLSAAIVAAAVVLHVRAGEGDGPAVPVVRRDLRIIGATLVGAVALTFAAGTVVTGTGPLAGNAAAPRFHLPFIGATQFHADIGWVIAALSFALLIGLPLSGAPRAAVRRIYLLAGLTLAQGAIGYAQYFSGLPAGLVWVHVTVAVVIWAVTVRLYLAMRERGPLPAGRPEPPAGAEAKPERAEPERAEPERPATTPVRGA
ncbi:MAG TPA: COX15/CtaA family protein [Streptosporangiaceae bacterium]|nr:COX15/CtaA family protein [Streptosporangiaceae bacterium]